MSLDRAIERLAGRQHTVFTRAQALAAGATPSTIRHRLGSGAWVRLASGVYALPKHDLGFKRQYKAAQLSIPGAAIAGRAAAALHRLAGCNVVAPELVVPLGAHHTSALGQVHRSDNVRTTVVDRITVTTIAQTLFDLAARVDPWTLERAMDDAIAAERLRVDGLAERLTALGDGRRRGIALMRGLVTERVESGWVPPESELEALLWRLALRLPDNPKLVCQAALPWREAAAGRVDILVPEWRTILEGDGRRWHTRVADFERDLWRNNLAAAHGYAVLRFTWVHLTRVPDAVVALVESTFHARAA